LLLGGAYFSDRRLLSSCRLAAMFLADLVIGLHSLIPVIYAASPPAAARLCVARQDFSPARRRLRHRRIVMFFIVVSFAEWLMGDTVIARRNRFLLRRRSPFLKTGSPDAVWSALLFGGFEVMKRRWTAWNCRSRIGGHRNTRAVHLMATCAIALKDKRSLARNVGKHLTARYGKRTHYSPTLVKVQ